MTEDRYTARIAGLLRKAAATTNEAEAEAYFAKAQELSTLYQIDLEVARTHTAKGQVREVPVQRVIDIGRAGKVGLRTYVDLFLAIGQINGVTCDIAHNATKVYAYGFESDIAMTEALYSTLVVQMAHTADAYIRSGDHLKEKVWRTKKVTVEDWYGYPTTETTQGYFPVSGRTARINFQTAFRNRVAYRLQQAKNTAVQTADTAAQQSAETKGSALVLVAREVEVTSFYKRTSDAKGKYRSSTVSSGSARAHRAGDHAGQHARLGTERAIGGHRAQVSA